MPATEDDAADPDLLIDFARVTLRRGGNVLVGPVTWAVELDERWVVIGPNGAGKTSLLRIAAAMEHPSSGTAYVLGERLGRVDMSELRSRVGLSSSALAQRVPDDEVVRDLVVSAGYAVLGRWREKYDDVDYAQAVDMLESVGAEHLADRTYGTLSEGERKRVLIARSLMTDPELLLLDEPAAGLDLGGREELVARLADLAADPDAPAIVLVTHHVEEIPQGFSHCLLLSEGKVVASGLLTDVLTAENLSKAFGQSIALDVDRRTLLRAAHPQPRGAQEADMTEDDPLVPRPAATVMLVRDTLERHQGLPDAAALGDGLRRRRDGVSRRRRRRPRPQRRHRLGRTGAVLVGAAIRRRRRPGRGAGVRRRPRNLRGIRRAVRRTGRRPATASSATRRSTAIPGRAGRQLAVVRRLPAQREAGAARRPAAAVGELGDAEGGAHPPLRHLLLRRRIAGGPARRRREHRNRPRRLDHAARRRSTTSPRAVHFLLPPTWTQLDSLAGRTVAEVLAVERQIVPVEPHLAVGNGNWEIEFFDSDRYNEARNRRAPEGYGDAIPDA